MAMAVESERKKEPWHKAEAPLLSKRKSLYVTWLAFPVLLPGSTLMERHESLSARSTDTGVEPMSGAGNTLNAELRRGLALVNENFAELSFNNVKAIHG